MKSFWNSIGDFVMNSTTSDGDFKWPNSSMRACRASGDKPTSSMVESSEEVAVSIVERVEQSVVEAGEREIPGLCFLG